MMTETQSTNRRIAKNTLIVYVQLFLSMAVNLVASRFVLQALGASDFGLYNVVGGVIAMFTFISSSLAGTTIRFLNFEMGRPGGNVNRMFNQSLSLHIVFAVAILLLLESVGVFYILNYLNVAPGKEADAMFVFQLSTVIACVGILCVPYRGMFIAHERFATVAVVDIVSVLVKLALVTVLLYYQGNALRFYALAMALVTTVYSGLYFILARRKWPRLVMWKPVKKWREYKEQFFFSNWNLMDTMAMVMRYQGAALLINLFFGTVVNAAYAIAHNVLQQVNNFVGKFDTAVAPQITQNISAGNEDRSVVLASQTCRVCILLMEIVYFALTVELGLVLSLWLKDVPEGTGQFCQLTLLVALVSSTSGGLYQLINGYGRIKWFKIQKCGWYMLSLVAGYVLFKLRYPAHVIVLLFVISDVLCRITQLLLLRRMFALNVSRFVAEAYFRPAVVFCVMMLFVTLYHSLHIESLGGRLAGIVLTIAVALVCVVFIGFRKSERKRMLEMVRR